MNVKALRNFQLYRKANDGYEYLQAFKDFETLAKFVTSHKVKNYRVTTTMSASKLIAGLK